MGVAASFRATEIGELPTTWDCVELGSLASVSSGGTPSRAEASYWGGEIPWITTTQIDYRLICEAPEKITAAGLASSAARLYKPGTLLMAMYGQGKTRGKVAITAIEAATNQACAAIVPNGSIRTQFLFHWLTMRYHHIRDLSNTGNQENLNSSLIRSILCPVPATEAEQEAIAEALSDADALIESLEQLIAKKRLIKQGAMQELLTGKRRLPGFDGEWEKSSFDELFDFHRTASNSRADLGADGDAFYIHYGDIHTKFQDHLDFSQDSPPRIRRELCSNATPLRNGDWVLADASEDYEGLGNSVEVSGLRPSQDAVAGLHTLLLREKRPRFAPGFKGHLSQSADVRSEFIRISTGLKVYALSKGAIRDLLLPIPPVDEQAAIVTVLNDMASELDALAQKFEKARMIKQGMMHNLLTGKIRLV